MARRSVRLLVLLILLSAFDLASNGQVAMPQFGIVPNGSYESYKVDNVNLENGNTIIKIPLFSLPQLGKLSLSFSVVGNTTAWTPEETCTPDDSECQFYYIDISPFYTGYPAAVPGTSPSIGPAIVGDSGAYVGSIPYDSGSIVYKFSYMELAGFQDAGVFPPTPPPCFTSPDGTQSSDCYSMYWKVYNSTGGSHSLYYDATNPSNMRTTDGSGFLYQSGNPNPSLGEGVEALPNNPSTPYPILIDSHGLKTTFEPTEMIQQDPDGNTISDSSTGITDTVGRIIPGIPLAIADTAKVCPDLQHDHPEINSSFQSVAGVSTWTVPGPNNQSTPYLICYANIRVHTDFFGGGEGLYQTADPNGFDYDVIETFDTNQIVSVIQSIVLPDKTYWGFVYDAADPAGANLPAGPIGDNEAMPAQYAGYGTLSALILPQGGTITYIYSGSHLQSCSSSLGSPTAVGERTVSDGNGHTYTWKYNIGMGTPASGGGPTSNNTVVTDPNGNDTVYGYGIPTFTTITANIDPCADLAELSRKEYQGSYTSGKLLRTVTKTYTAATEPLVAQLPTSDNLAGFGNLLPQTVTTTLDNGSSSTATTGDYVGTFAATMPTYGIVCNGAQAPDYICHQVQAVSIPTTVVNLSLAIPTSTSTTDYSSTGYAGSILNTTQTQYQWQTDYNYFAANLLDTPTVVTTYNGNVDSYSPNGQMVAQTITSYDEPNYIANNGVIAGDSTTVSRWNNLGAAIITHTKWTPSGMVSQTIDGRGNAAATYNYQAGPIYPSSVTNALGQTTAYTWDFNTGKIASITDPSGILTNYLYESGTGRIAQVQSAAGTSSESHRTYTYPDANTVNAFQDQNARGDGLQKWTSYADGLGREIHQTSPGGANVDTQYDGFDQVLSVSNPYISTNDPTFGLTSFAYDALGRKTYACHPDNGTGFAPCVAGSSYQHWLYSGNKTTSYDELGNATQQWSDALGRLTTVVEPGSLGTAYSYDALGNLANVSQAGNGNSDAVRFRSFTYDSLSRLTSSSNPETGLICYGSGTNCANGYDGNGNLLSKTDGRGVTASYLYDVGNRVLSKTFANAPAGTLSSCYQYDSASNGIGRLTAEWTQAGACPPTAPTSGFQSKRTILAYDPLGRVWNEQQCTLGHCTSGPAPPCAGAGISAPFYQTYCYDLAGNTTWYANGVTNVPGGVNSIAFTPVFDANGRPSGLGSSWNDSLHPSPLFTVDPATGYTPTNALQKFGLGNHILVQKTYDNRLRTTSEDATPQ
jgi:YD repeat-containing protein